MPAIFIIAMLLLASAWAALAGITYDPATNVIQVMDYPEDAPATLDAILAADQQNGWGRVSYDKAADTYTVKASVWIGIDQGLGTFMQIGRSGHPRETLIIHGNVWVKPPRLSLKRPDGRFSVVNRLTLGDPTNAAIRATLKIACATRGQYAVQVGEGWGRTRGDLHMYNSVITAAIPDRDHRLGAQNWYGSDLRVIQSTLSWINGTFMYGVQNGNGVVEGSTFEHGGIVLQNGGQYARNCVFRDLEIAVAEGGCLNATLVGCTLVANQQNWTLGSVQSEGITLIDCQVGLPKQPYRINKNNMTTEQARRPGVTVYPVYRERRSLVIKVVGTRGKGLSDAFVHVTCPEAPAEVTHGLTLTDAKGLTPDKLENKAILITSKKLQATEDPARPQAFSLLYTITVQAKGYQAQTLRISQGQDLPRPLVVALQKPSLIQRLRSKPWFRR